MLDILRRKNGIGYDSSLLISVAGLTSGTSSTIKSGSSSTTGTACSVTDIGKQAFEEYVESLRSYLNL